MKSLKERLIEQAIEAHNGYKKCLQLAFEGDSEDMQFYKEIGKNAVRVRDKLIDDVIVIMDNEKL